MASRWLKAKTAELAPTVEVEGRTLTTRAVVIATGSRPWLPPIPGLDAVEPLTCDTLLQLHERPDRLLILGGGAGACEFAQLFQRMGSVVTVASPDERLLDQKMLKLPVR